VQFTKYLSIYDIIQFQKKKQYFNVLQYHFCSPLNTIKKKGADTMKCGQIRPLHPPKSCGIRCGNWISYPIGNQPGCCDHAPIGCGKPAPANIGCGCGNPPPPRPGCGCNNPSPHAGCGCGNSHNNSWDTCGWDTDYFCDFPGSRSCRR